MAQLHSPTQADENVHLRAADPSSLERGTSNEVTHLYLQRCLTNLLPQVAKQHGYPGYSTSTGSRENVICCSDNVLGWTCRVESRPIGYATGSPVGNRIVTVLAEPPWLTKGK